MICRNCGHSNWSYVGKCPKCDTTVYIDDLKGQRVRKRLAGSLIGFLIFLVISITLFIHDNKLHINNMLIVLGIISGILLGLYMINSNKRYVDIDISHEQEKLNDGWRFGTAVIVYSILNIIIYFYDETFTSITSYIYIPLSITLLLGILISNIWLIFYERNLRKKSGNGSI